MEARARILLVEDDPDVADALQVRLEAAGHAVLAARTKEESLFALNNLRRRAPDRGGVEAIVLDVMLPDGNGFEILRAVRTDPILERTPVLMLTSLTAGHFVESGFVAGANAYLPKPVDPRRLIAAIDRLVAEADDAVAADSASI